MPNPYALLTVLALPAAGVIGSAAPVSPSKPPMIAPQKPSQKKQPLALKPLLVPHIKQDYVVAPLGGEHFYILIVLPPKNMHY